MKLEAISKKKWYFVNNCLIKVRSSNLKILLHTCDTYNWDYLPHTTFCFYLIDFKLNTNISLPIILLSLIVKSPTLLKNRFLKNLLIKRDKPVPFPSQNCRFRWFLHSNWRQFQVFKITEFEFKISTLYTKAYWHNAPSCDTLSVGLVEHCVCLLSYHQILVGPTV